jgi:hypothetical protein
MSRDCLASFVLKRSKRGDLNIQCVETGTLLHSNFAPQHEAEQIVDALACTDERSVLLIGGGAGYLQRELRARLSRDARLTVFEPEPELCALSAANNELDVGFPGIQRVASTSKTVLSELISSLSESTRVIIAPYLKRTARNRRSPLFQMLHALASEESAGTTYYDALRVATQRNQVHLETMPPWTDLKFEREREICVVGAGPSLDNCAPALRDHRAQLTIIAASGAVPALLRHNIQPECVVALEALLVCTEDLANLPNDVPVIVFNCTSPAVLTAHAMLLRGDPPFAPLTTRGGSTIIPALDLGLKSNAQNIYLVGVDLGQGPQAYANGTHRQSSSVLNEQAPKFRAMRYHLENLISVSTNSSRVWHALISGVPLRGTRRITPEELRARLQHIKKQVAQHA